MFGHLFLGVALALITSSTVLMERVTIVDAMIGYIVAGSLYMLQSSALELFRAWREPDNNANDFEAKVEPAAQQATGYRILAVDDDPLARDILEAMLGQIDGVTVDLCESAKDAQMQLMTRDYDCYFLDIEMPGMDGVELANWIRSVHGDASTPIVMATAMTDRRNVVEAFLVGANDYITKPFDAVEIAKRVADAQEMDLTPKVVLPDEINAQPKGRITTTQSLQNYLMQLNRGGLFATNLFTVKADLTVWEKLGMTDEAIQAAAEALRHVSFDRSFLLTYVGDGVFLCAVNGAERDLMSTFANFPTEVDGPDFTVELALQDVRSLRLPMAEAELLATPDRMIEAARATDQAAPVAAHLSA